MNCRAIALCHLSAMVSAVFQAEGKSPASACTLARKRSTLSFSKGFWISVAVSEAL